MRALSVLLSLAAPLARGDETLPAANDPATVEGLPRSGPLAYRAVAEISHEHGCSQSFESQSFTARFALTVDGEGHARLTLEADDSYVFGPSPGRYRSGDHQFDRRNTPSKGSWSGTGRRSGERLSLDLRADAGGAPLRMECKVAPIEVAKSWQDERLPTRVKALLCDSAETLVGKHFDLSVGGALPFGRNSGFEASIGRMDISGGEPSVHLTRAL